jgi:hypothetical protein
VETFAPCVDGIRLKDGVRPTDKSGMNGLSWGPRGLLALSLSGCLGLALAGCDGTKTSSTSNGGSIPTYRAAEKSYCATPISYSAPKVTIDGLAQYKRREPYGTNTPGPGGLGTAAGASTHPIRYAEVRVTNGAGVVIQCTETDGSGNYSFEVPFSATALYTVAVVARSNNNYVKAYVYDDPRYNNLYAVTSTFTPSVSQTLATLTAGVTNGVGVIGAAFNILDQILEANDYLRAEVGSCSATYGTCANFTVAPRATVYWKLGFNPAEYYGAASSGISYYLPGYSRLFILGGIDGDSDASDTDHFDNSIILHEYGHFLEDVVLHVSDSPGGSHDGRKVIDPRLAWSEGWGNFFQAAVRGDPHYIDTMGNLDGGAASTDYLFYVDLENQAGIDTMDDPQNPGEGSFREFSVTRLLWDAIDVGGAADEAVSGGFIELWHSLMSTSGFRRPSAAFHQIGHMHRFQDTLSPGTDWSPLRTLESHGDATEDYAQYVTTTGGCTYSLTPSTQTNDGQPDSGIFARSHLVLNNDFYHLKVTSTQTMTLTLNYSDDNGAGTIADLDLYLYNVSGRIGNPSDIIGRSESTPSGTVATPQMESISIRLAPGNYLLNVKAYTGGAIGTKANYTLTKSGVQLCPASLP